MCIHRGATYHISRPRVAQVQSQVVVPASAACVKFERIADN